MTQATLGTISEGTLRSEDLIPVFVRELERLTGVPADIRNSEWIDRQERGAWVNPIEFEEHEEEGSELVEELTWALNECALPHTYFGAHSGDGADFGFWPDMDSFDGCKTEQLGVPSALSRENRWVDLDCELHVSINDHGNVTVSTIPGEIVWDCV